MNNNNNKSARIVRIWEQQLIRRANVRQISSGRKRLVKALVVAHFFGCHLGWHSKALGEPTESC